ncbi:MAG: transglycosylase SLT domain-containing protein [Herpetosiphon sp.]
MLALAHDQRIAGEYGPLEATLAVLASHVLSTEMAREVSFRQGEVAWLQQRPAAAALSAFLDSSPTHDDWYGQALFLLARSYETAGQHAAASAAYKRYIELHTPLEAYAQLRLAAQAEATRDRVGQLRALQSIGTAAMAGGVRVEVLERLLPIYQASGDRRQIVAAYSELIAIATKPAYRAQLLWRAAQAAGGDEGRRWLETLVQTLPMEREAADGVELLQRAGAGPASYQAGRIFFWHDRWKAAVAQFDVALRGELLPQDSFEAQRLRGLALRESGDNAGALQVLGGLAQVTPGSDATMQAELDYVQTVGRGGNLQQAIGGYQRFVEQHPTHALAAEALWRIVQLQQRQDQAEGAAVTAETLGQRYPESEQAHKALRDVAVRRLRQGAVQQAIADWQQLGAHASGEDRAAGLFWSGAFLLERQGAAAAQETLQGAVDAAPESYYAARARELLQRPETEQAPFGVVATAAEQKKAEEWLGSWSTRAVHADANRLKDVIDAPAVQRARTLAAVGLQDEAQAEWTDARQQWQDDPEQLWELALLASSAGEARAAFKIAERVVELSPGQRITRETPVALLRLLYPAPYARVAQQYAADAKVDARLLFSVLRQESEFNPRAESGAGALGLAQVMPATAQGIAQSLQMAQFRTTQLFEPAVAIRFGAFYLGQQLGAFGGNPQAAIAAYNGGPGNAQRWLAETRDPDLMTESIDFRESREYVRLVYGNWGMYRRLYGE